APLPAEHGYNVLNGHNEEPVISLKVHRDRVLGVEQDAVVPLQGIITVLLNLRRNRDDPPRERGNLDLVRQVDPALGLLLVLVLPDQDPLADGLDNLEGLGRARAFGGGHRRSLARVACPACTGVGRPLPTGAEPQACRPTRIMPGPWNSSAP